MITKYNMISGELTCQSKQDRTVPRHRPNELADLTASLQLIEIEVRQETKGIPADLISVPIAGFLRRQG